MYFVSFPWNQTTVSSKNRKWLSQHINLGCLCYFISYESFLCKNSISTTQQYRGERYCILELCMHTIFFILFLCVGSLHCSSPKLLGWLNPREICTKCEQNVDWTSVRSWKSSFDPFGSIWTHVFSTFQDGSNQAYWVHVIWSQLLEDELLELPKTFHFYRSINNMYIAVCHSSQPILHHQNTIVLYMWIHYNSHQSKASVACIFFVYESGFSSVHPSWSLDKPYPLWELRIVIFLFCFFNLLSSLVFLRCILFEKGLLYYKILSFFQEKVAYQIVVLGHCT